MIANQNNLNIPNDSDNEIVLTVSISKKITSNQIVQFNNAEIIELSINSPQDGVIKFKEQLDKYTNIIYSIIDKIQTNRPNSKKIHLLYSGQSCLAFEIGKLLDDTFPEIISYKFNNNSYPWGIIINGTNKNKLIKT